MDTPIVTLTTDFGLRDPYVGIMKGVLWGICPNLRIADLTHSLSSHELVQTSFVLGAAIPYFPDGTIHVVVVDPGVGTERRGIAVEFEVGIAVGPDNGIIPAALEGRQVGKMVSLESEKHRLPLVSATFHGRDIFSPVAAHLANGVGMAEFGPKIDDPVLLEIPKPKRTAKEVIGEILYQDHFGNLITNIDEITLKSGPKEGPLRVLVGDLQIPEISKTYAEVPTGMPLAVIGSHGHLEIACNRGSAADILGLRKGDQVRARSSQREKKRKS